MYKVFEKYCPICESVQFNAYTVAQLWFGYYISRQSSENVLNLQIWQYFPNNLYLWTKLVCQKWLALQSVKRNDIIYIKGKKNNG